jgi:serine/threonine-protein kinase
VGERSEVDAAGCADEPAAARPGYRVEALIGIGYRAHVFRVVELASRRAYAAKIFAPDPAGRAAAADEAAALRALAHRRAPALRDRLDHAGWPIVVMSLVPGRSLRSEVAAAGPLALGPTLDLAIEAAEPLAHVAAQGWSFRDLHPRNIHLHTPIGAMLLDFDGARPPGSPARPAGRIGYRAPELDGDGPISPACDVYSLAGCLHFALTGDDPHESSAHPLLDDLLAACRQTDPAARPSMAALRGELERRRAALRTEG